MMGTVIRFALLVLLLCVFSSSISSVIGPLTTPMGGGFMGAPPYNPLLPIPRGGNLAPAFTYTQSGLSLDIQKIMAKWNQKISNATSDIEKLKSTEKEIAQDRAFFTAEGQRSVLSQEDINSLRQYELVLDYAELILMVKSLPQAEQAFPTTYKNSLEKTPQRLGNQSVQKNPEWYIQKAERLSFLLSRFQAFLQANPEYSQNPPTLLPQLELTFDKASKAFEKYQQFRMCLSTSPNEPICRALGAQTQQNNNSSGGWNQDGGWDQDNDFDGQEIYNYNR